MKFCLVSRCDTRTTHEPLCADCRSRVPEVMLLMAHRTPALWLDVARYVEGLRAEVRSMRRDAA